MFNSPILDVTIGLVFIFFLYSLLVSTVQEAIASTLSLRARMLRHAIRDRMLSNTNRGSGFIGMMNRLWGYVKNFLRFLRGSQQVGEPKVSIADQFYQHPLIRNYGSNRVYSIPSYIPKESFSKVVVELFDNEFNRQLTTADELESVLPLESRSSVPMTNSGAGYKMQKIQTLLEGYTPEKKLTRRQQLATLEHNPPSTRKDSTIDPTTETASKIEFLDQDTQQLLLMLFQKSKMDLKKFEEELDKWFDDTMNRVSGWYKRQTQWMVFGMGLVAAILFNVDTIEIVQKLSTNADMRKLLVQEASAYIEAHPELAPALPQPDTTRADTVGTDPTELSAADSLAEMYHRYKEHLRIKKSQIDSVNSILALGWGDYGQRRNSERILENIFKKDEEMRDRKGYEPLPIGRNSPAVAKQAYVAQLYKDHPWKYKGGFVISEVCHARKLIGLLLTAFAISLGAPFWFDLLKKVMSVRSTGKPEGTDGGGGDKKDTPTPPIVIQTNPGTQAVG